MSYNPETALAYRRYKGMASLGAWGRTPHATVEKQVATIKAEAGTTPLELLVAEVKDLRNCCMAIMGEPAWRQFRDALPQLSALNLAWLKAGYTAMLDCGLDAMTAAEAVAVFKTASHL